MEFERENYRLLICISPHLLSCAIASLNVGFGSIDFIGSSEDDESSYACKTCRGTIKI